MTKPQTPTNSYIYPARTPVVPAITDAHQLVWLAIDKAADLCVEHSGQLDFSKPEDVEQAIPEVVEMLRAILSNLSPDAAVLISEAVEAGCNR